MYGLRTYRKPFHQNTHSIILSNLTNHFLSQENDQNEFVFYLPFDQIKSLCSLENSSHFEAILT